MMHLGTTGLSRIGALALVLGCLPACAQDHPQSLTMAGYPMPIERHIRMKEGATGALVRYFNRIMTGGQECTTTPNNTVECLNWDGLTSFFEVTLEGVTETDALELRKGAIAAIEAVCPSTIGMGLRAADLTEVDTHFYRLEAGCPAADAIEGGN